MKKIVRDVFGISLFVMSYYQVHRQTEYKNELKSNPTPSTAAISVKTQPAFAFSLNHVFIK
jgi:hypothetical protein